MENWNVPYTRAQYTLDEVNNNLGQNWTSQDFWVLYKETRRRNSIRALWVVH